MGENTDENNGATGPHDNDADSRPRVYMKAGTDDAMAEVVVKGAEGENTNDVADVADERLDRAVAAADELDSESEDERGVQ